MDFDSQWVEIFRVGDYGDKGRFSLEDLAMMVGNFKCGVWKPPLVIGHPDHDSPAHGWVKDMRISAGGRLEMIAGQVSPQLESLVRTGRFPNRSIAIYKDPKGTGPVVRHIGFLGAMPPEVKGLAPIRFATFADEEFVAIEFREGTGMRVQFTEPRNGQSVSGLGLAGRAQEIYDQARARGNKAFSYGEAHGIAFREFSEAGADQDKPLAEQESVRRFAEGELPTSGRYAVVNMGRSQRIEALLEEAAVSGKKLDWSEANEIARNYEARLGLDANQPLTFAETQRELRAMRSE